MWIRLLLHSLKHNWWNCSNNAGGNVAKMSNHRSNFRFQSENVCRESQVTSLHGWCPKRGWPFKGDFVAGQRMRGTPWRHTVFSAPVCIGRHWVSLAGCAGAFPFGAASSTYIYQPIFFTYLSDIHLLLWRYRFPFICKAVAERRSEKKNQQLNSAVKQRSLDLLFGSVICHSWDSCSEERVVCNIFRTG